MIGFDIERHDYGSGKKYPSQLVLQDVMTLHGSQFRDAAVIVASPPCQEYSYMAMPWQLAKAKQARIQDDPHECARLTALFDTCFRIQREASWAAGRHVPLIVENVRGAQRWVGRAKWNFGSFYLWGDVPALMPITLPREVMKRGVTHRGDDSTNFHGHKGVRPEHIKQGGDWFNSEQPSISRMTGSKTKARKAASAEIAKIPFTLSEHIAKVFKVEEFSAR